MEDFQTRMDLAKATYDAVRIAGDRRLTPEDEATDFLLRHYDLGEDKDVLLKRVHNIWSAKGAVQAIERQYGVTHNGFLRNPGELVKRCDIGTDRPEFIEQASARSHGFAVGIRMPSRYFIKRRGFTRRYVKALSIDEAMDNLKRNIEQGTGDISDLLSISFATGKTSKYPAKHQDSFLAYFLCPQQDTVDHEMFHVLQNLIGWPTLPETNAALYSGNQNLKHHLSRDMKKTYSFFEDEIAIWQSFAEDPGINKKALAFLTNTFTVPNFFKMYTETISMVRYDGMKGLPESRLKNFMKQFPYQ